MSALAWIGLIWLYLMGFFGLLGIPEVIRKKRTEPKHGTAAVILFILAILALVAVWSSSSFAWANITFAVLVAEQVLGFALFFRSLHRGYKVWTSRGIVVDFLWIVAEIVLVSLLAFA